MFFLPNVVQRLSVLGVQHFEDKAYCYVCSMFQRGVGREKAELAWIEGAEDWWKMK